jgi:hypothetical protein
MDTTMAVAEWLMNAAIEHMLERGLRVNPGLKLRTLGGMWTDEADGAAFQIETDNGPTLVVTVTRKEG